MVKTTRGYRVWDPSSEEALRAGVRKHGLGAWEHIRKDPQFAILSDRTGVQLKDKWRNLVKFRHIDPDEQRTYKPKTQGPWSKKYKRERSQGLSGTASPASGDGGVSEDEGPHQGALQPQANGAGGEGTDLTLAAAAAAVAVAAEAAQQPQQQLAQQPQQQLAQQPQRQSGRTSAQKRKAFTDLALMLEGDTGDHYPGSDGDEGAGSGLGGGGDAVDGGGARRSRQQRSVGRFVARSNSARQRKAQEDRRFGIYDRRRYGFAEDGSGVLGRSMDADAVGPSEDGHGSEADGARAHNHGPQAYGAAGVAPPPRVRRRNGSASRRGGGGGRGRSDEEEEEEDADEEEGQEEGSDDPMDDGAAGSGAGVDDGDGAAGEEYVISCPCGVTYDDGDMMIECESCAAWAHVACLRHQMATQPDKFQYNFETYHCAACKGALQSLQQGGGGGFGGSSPHGQLQRSGSGFRGRRGGGLASPSATDLAAGCGRNGSRIGAAATAAAAAAVGGPGGGDGDGDGDGDTASEDSQRKELSSILLGMANGRLGSGVSVSVSGRRSGGLLQHASSSPNVADAGGGGGGNLSKSEPFGHAPFPTVAGQRGGGGSPMARSLSLGRTSSSGLGGTAAGAHGAALDGGSRVLLKPGPAGGPSEGGRRALVAGPASSTGSRGRLDGAASPPLVPDGGLPLFQTAAAAAPCASGGSGGGAAGGSGATKIFKPIPKLATVSGLPEPVRQQQQQLSAPKARPHPALQQGASQSNMQRMLEAANPLSIPIGGSGGTRSMPLSSVLEAAGPLQVVAANLCAATGRKVATAAASVSTNGTAAASDGGGSCDAAAATAAGGLPPRPPSRQSSRPPSSMAREVANRIFGESDDDDLSGLGRPMSALRGPTTDPWFLMMPPSLSRAATPSALIDILRATPDIVPVPGTSPPPHLAAAALAAVRSVSPGAAYLPALLAQQQQQQAAMHQFLAQAALPPAAPSAALPPAQPGQASAAAAAAASLILPPPPLARPTPLAPPPPPAFPPLALGGVPPGWPAGAPPPPPPPPPGALHPPSSSNEPVTLHPVLRHLLLTTAQQQHHHQQQHQQPPPQQQQQQQQQQRVVDGSVPQPQQPSQQPQGGGGGSGAVNVACGSEPTSARREEDAADAAPPPFPQHHHHQRQHSQPQQQQQHQQQQPPQVQTVEERASSGGAAVGLMPPPPLTRSTPTPPLSQPGLAISGSGGSTLGQGAAAIAAAAAMAAAANGPAGGGAASTAPSVLDGSGSSTVATLLGLNVGGLNLNVLEHWRSASPDPWGIFRTSTPGPEAILQSFLHPPPSADINSLPWIKSGTPPLSVAELIGGPPSAGGADLHSLDR